LEGLPLQLQLLYLPLHPTSLHIILLLGLLKHILNPLLLVLHYNQPLLPLKDFLLKFPSLIISYLIQIPYLRLQHIFNLAS